MHYLDPIIAELSAIEANQEIKPVEAGNLRDAAIAKGLRAIAAHYGKTLVEPLHIDANGEYRFTITNDGEYGNELVALINHIPLRTGVSPSKGTMLGCNGWCRINHFDAERLLKIAHQQQA
ncbi:hypothetical protein D3C87_686450 [compost metagenome]